MERYCELSLLWVYRRTLSSASRRWLNARWSAWLKYVRCMTASSRTWSQINKLTVSRNSAPKRRSSLPRRQMRSELSSAAKQQLSRRRQKRPRRNCRRLRKKSLRNCNTHAAKPSYQRSRRKVIARYSSTTLASSPRQQTSVNEIARCAAR